MAPEAAAALESSSAAAADALHGILVQVAMARGEDTTTFVKKALKDPSVMQVLPFPCKRFCCLCEHTRCDALVSRARLTNPNEEQKYMRCCISPNCSIYQAYI